MNQSITIVEDSWRTALGRTVDCGSILKSLKHFVKEKEPVLNLTNVQVDWAGYDWILLYSSYSAMSQSTAQEGFFGLCRGEREVSKGGAWARWPYFEPLNEYALDVTNSPFTLSSVLWKTFNRTADSDDEGDLIRYLDSLERRREITRSTGDLAVKVWKKLKSILSQRMLMVPDAAPGPDGNVLLAFDNGRDHFEVEILPCGAIEIFYLNRDTNEMLEWDTTSELDLGSDQLFVERLSIFCGEPNAGHSR